MAINWSHLPKEVISRVCMDSMGNKEGYGLDRATGYWVHRKCGKPSIAVAVKECDICEKTFVPRFYIKCQLDFMGIMCDQCDPPNEVKEFERLGYTPKP